MMHGAYNVKLLHPLFTQGFNFYPLRRTGGFTSVVARNAFITIRCNKAGVKVLIKHMCNLLFIVCELGNWRSNPWRCNVP